MKTAKFSSELFGNSTFDLFHKLLEQTHLSICCIDTSRIETRHHCSSYCAKYRFYFDSSVCNLNKLKLSHGDQVAYVLLENQTCLVWYSHLLLRFFFFEETEWPTITLPFKNMENKIALIEFSQTICDQSKLFLLSALFVRIALYISFSLFIGNVLFYLSRLEEVKRWVLRDPVKKIYVFFLFGFSKPHARTHTEPHTNNK